MAEGNPGTGDWSSLFPSESPPEEEGKPLLTPLLTEEDNTSTSEKNSPPSPLPTEAAGREISIVLAGKSGAGKSSLARNILGVEEVEEASAAPKTQECNTQEATKNGVTLKVTDTVGLIGDRVKRSKELKKLTKHTKGKTDVLVYCILVTQASIFEDGNPGIMKSLQRAYGPDIWKHCIVALTFSNVTLNTFKSKYNNEKAISEYKKLLKHHAELFKQELEKLKVREVNVETIFGYHQFSQDDQSMIVAIPVGWEPDDPVLPELDVSEIPASPISEEIKNWNNILYIEMVRKGNAEVKRSLLKYRYGPKIVDSIVSIAVGATSGAAGGVTVGVAIGAGIGAIVGLLGGPEGIPVGAAIGAAIGGAVGGLGGGTGGGLIGYMRRKIKKKNTT